MGESTGDVTCRDVDECLQNLHNCHDNSICTNTDGSFVCGCVAGYDTTNTAADNGVECTDVDECEGNNHHCVLPNSYCENTEGTYLCQCATGYWARGDL